MVKRLLHLTPATIVLTVALFAAYAALTACTTVQPYATCENARIAVQLAQRAADRFCPMEALP